jgi:hypothetical protein
VEGKESTCPAEVGLLRPWAVVAAPKKRAHAPRQPLRYWRRTDRWRGRVPGGAGGRPAQAGAPVHLLPRRLEAAHRHTLTGAVGHARSATRR